MKKIIPIIFIVIYGCSSSNYINKDFKNNLNSKIETLAIIPIIHQLNFEPDSAYYEVFKKSGYNVVNTFELNIKEQKDSIKAILERVFNLTYNDDELNSNITLENKIGKGDYKRILTMYTGAKLLIVPAKLSIEQASYQGVYVVGKVKNTCYDLTTGKVVFYFEDNVNVGVDGSIRRGGLVSSLGITHQLHENLSEQGRLCSKLLALNCKNMLDEVGQTNSK